MKLILILSSLFVMLDAACNRHPAPVTLGTDSIKAVAMDTVKKEPPQVESLKTKGKVSHRYASIGCATVILVESESGGEQILIPISTLDKELDKDGQIIYFNYQPLKRMQPEGCTTGIPVALTDISVR
jgi:hypothetical protein